ncbi:hypothetical protein [Nocardioides gilvus]|uniref:hypothetical protein n=1 Tax=Nocardioides gilvus TaxID=1735589 RepID=UPI000D74A81E|nr:hypothetical protein [Nocardioides gilvus]
MPAASHVPSRIGRLHARLRGQLAGVRVWRPVATLLALAVATLSSLVLMAAPAQACSCADSGLRALTSDADLVFTGVLERATTGEGDEGRDQFLVRAQRVFKGTITNARFVVTNALGGSCGFGPVEEGSRWLFLTDSENRTTICSGTRPVAQRDLAVVQRQLGVGVRVKAPDPQAAVRTKVEESEPETFARLAAPGAAAVLLGLLGLAVVGRLNRR